MSKNRLEGFSDGVLAVIITIMVLEMKVPHGGDVAALLPLLPVFISYLLSFVFIGVYWNNHHHLLHAASHVTGRILWANLHMLFWLSLVPFVTGWMGENDFAALPVALYGFVQLMAGFAFFILAQSLVATHGRESSLAKAIGNDFKGKASLVVYLVAVPLAFFSPLAAFTLYVAVAAVWFVPDRRIERAVVR
jgi:uncharacterized membrane protein